MNRFGGNPLRDLEARWTDPPRGITHREVQADIADYLARGGRIEQGVSVQLRAARATDRDGTTRRWVDRPAPRSATEAGMTATRYKRRQGIVLPGSLSGPR